MKKPEKRIVVLGYATPEKKWVPVEWVPQVGLWFCELTHASTVTYNEAEISTWIPMPAPPESEES